MDSQEISSAVVGTPDSQKRKRIYRSKFQHQNKLYTYDKEVNSAKYYRCKDRSICTGRLVVRLDNTVELKKPHSCLVTAFECDINSARSKIRELSLANPFLPPSKIIIEAQATFKPETLQALPREDVLKCAVKKYRQPTGVKEAKTRGDIQLTSFQTKTTSGERFLLHDSQDDNRILIFASDALLKELENCSVWCIDGTFDVVSPLYTQLVTIHGISSRGDANFVFPLIYCLLPDKKASTYKYVYNYLKNCGVSLKPQLILLDFELANIKALRESFPKVILQGCHFHFVQSLYRNFSTKMKELYEGYDFSLYIKKVFALAFVRFSDVRQAFNLIVTSSSYTDELKNDLDIFFAYVERTYIGDEYSPPKYSHVFWSVHDRVKDNQPRTNNAVESWHRRITVLAECSHPPLRRLINLICQEEKHTVAQIASKLSGAVPAPTKYHQRKLDSRLLNLTLNYDDIDLWDFVVGISFNMSCVRGSRKGVRNRLEVIEAHFSDSETEHVDSTPEEMPTQVLSAPSSSKSASGFDQSYSTARVTKPRSRKNEKNPIANSTIETRSSKRLKLK